MARHLPSRRSTHGIMANAGFGLLSIHTPEGVILEIPQSCIKQDGSIKVSIMKRTQQITRENCEYLESKGVKVYVGKGA